jgi:hypothetical protein
VTQARRPLVGEEVSLALIIRISVARAGRRAICAAVDMLLHKDTMDMRLTLEDLRQT